MRIIRIRDKMKSRGGSLTTQEPQERQRGKKIMRSSNSKETRRAVEAYVLAELENRRDNYDDPDTMRPVSWAFGILRSEMRYQSDQTETGYPIHGEGLAAKYRKAGRYGFIEANTPYWVMFLAVSAGCFDCDYYAQRQAVAAWMDETPEEAARYSNEDVYKRYRHMTAQAFERLYERETTPHKVSTADFIALFNEHNPNSPMFARKTMRFWGMTRKDVSVYAFELVTDYTGTVHDCYVVSLTTRPDGYRRIYTHYFDRETFEEIYTPEEA